MSSHTRATGSLRWVGVSHRTLMAWRLLSAIMLLVMGGIHLYLVFDGVGGSLGVLFVLMRWLARSCWQSISCCFCALSGLWQRG